MKEVMLRRKKDEVLDLPPKIRSWVPVEIDSPAAVKAQRTFAEWLAGGCQPRLRRVPAAVQLSTI
jgi:hypothetical protein